MTLTSSQLRELKSLGVTPMSINDNEPAKGVILLYGREKQGKTHWPLTGPDPVLFIDIDIGTRGMVNKFLETGKDIHRTKLVVPAQLGRSSSEDIKRLAQKELNKLYKIYDWALDTNAFRLIIIDTSTELYNLFLLAHHGKTTKIMPEHRGLPNNEFSEFVKRPIDNDKVAASVIHLARAKDEWVNNESTGNQIPEGYNRMGNLVEAILQTTRTDPRRRAKGVKPKEGAETEPVFKIIVKDHRHDISMIGTEFVLNGVEGEPEMFGVTPFAYVMKNLFPRTKYKDWT